MLDWRKMGALHLEIADKRPDLEAAAHLKMMHSWQKMNVLDQESFRVAHAMFGEENHTRWLASIPMSVWSLVLDLHPHIMQSKEELHKWLRANPQYLVPNTRSKSTHFHTQRAIPGLTTTTG